MIHCKFFERRLCKFGGTDQVVFAIENLAKFQNNMAFIHVNVQQDLKDVKLWQVYTLLKGLENIAASADIPMLVCGDFSSVLEVLLMRF
ncbi:putative poly(A)-specific ribonuclease [Helianthus debilis subsp. tardiflorus]